MQVVGFKRGTPGTKYENSLGALECASSDGKVRCFASGIADDLRDEIWNNQDEFLGKVVTVKCNGLSQNADGEYSLLHPRFMKFRDDKESADSLEEIQKIADAVASVS